MPSISIQYPLDIANAQVPEHGQVIAIGDFDGVHLGHQEVIRQAVELARRLGVPAAVLTFDPHPREVLGKEQYCTHLTPLPAKLAVLEQLGVDHVYIMRFDIAFSQIAPAQFVDEVLLPLRVHSAVVGFDFHFGHKGAGDVNQLAELAAGSFAVHVVDALCLDGEKVSSTAVRSLLDNGEAEQVQRLLGRRYTMTGHVVEGHARGRQLGFPTANIALDQPYIVPANGVYAARITIDGMTHTGVMNIGVKPTFAGESRSVEMHIFDFAQTIYGKAVQLELVRYIRPERKFGSIDELVQQIRQDAETAKQIHMALAP